MVRKMKLGFILAIAAVALLVATACSSLGGNGAVNQQLVGVTRGDIAVSVTGGGTIETSREARPTFGSGGKVAQILVKEGDVVREGDVLVRLDIRPLELARTQSEVALTQAELALTQAQLALKTAEHNLKSTRSSEDALKLAVLNAQISLNQAQYNLNTGIAAVDYDLAYAELQRAKVWHEYVLDRLTNASSDKGDEWLLALDRAEERLDVAQTNYNNALSGYNSQDIDIRKKRVEAAGIALILARKDLDDLVDDIALKELQVTSANQSAAGAPKSVELARQALVDAQRQLDEATIVAPFDSLVAAVMVKDGDIVPSPSFVPKTVVQLIDPSLMELVVEIDEIDIPMVRLGKAAVVTVDALPRREFKGTVTAIHPVPKEEGGVVLYDVRLSLETPEDSGIKIGMSASAKIIFEERRDVLTVPSRAVVENDQGGTIVNVISDGQVAERPVVIGLDDGLRAEVISGLSEGETVVVETRPKSTNRVGVF